MKTSIHIEPVKPGSEAHNKREKALDYVRKELSKYNEYWENDTQSNRLALIKAKYEATVGQKMQKKATPIREGVVVIQKSTTMADLQRLAAEYERRYGIRVFQIAIHKDEGHVAAKEWKPNLHAHLVFDWSRNNGKAVRLSREQMCEMQSLTAEILGMERGHVSDRKHLSSVTFKIEEKKKQLEQLQKELQKIDLSKTSKETLASVLEWAKGLLSQSGKDREIELLKDEIGQLQAIISHRDAVIQKQNQTITETKLILSERALQVENLNKDLANERIQSNKFLDVIIQLKKTPKIEDLLKIVNDCQNNAIDIINGTKNQPWLEDSLAKLYSVLDAKSQREREALGRYVVATVEDKLDYEQSVKLENITDRIAEEDQTRSQRRGWFGRG